MAKEHPLLLSGSMVRAVLSGRKTQTRRLLTKGTTHSINIGFDDVDWSSKKLRVAECVDPDGRSGPCITSMPKRDSSHHLCIKGVCPRWSSGDRLWFRETWAVAERMNRVKPRDIEVDSLLWYGANGEQSDSNRGKWRPSIFMPRWVCRLVVSVIEVRIERIQEITKDDAIAEGFPSVTVFRKTWDALNAKRGGAWDENPWVIALTFEEGISA